MTSAPKRIDRRAIAKNLAWSSPGLVAAVALPAQAASAQQWSFSQVSPTSASFTSGQQVCIAAKALVPNPSPTTVTFSSPTQVTVYFTQPALFFDTPTVAVATEGMYCSVGHSSYNQQQLSNTTIMATSAEQQQLNWVGDLIQDFGPFASFQPSRLPYIAYNTPKAQASQGGALVAGQSYTVSVAAQYYRQGATIGDQMVDTVALEVSQTGPGVFGGTLISATSVTGLSFFSLVAPSEPGSYSLTLRCPATGRSATLALTI